jgi:hypothetical protein
MATTAVAATARLSTQPAASVRRAVLFKGHFLTQGAEPPPRAGGLQARPTDGGGEEARVPLGRWMNSRRPLWDEIVTTELWL